MRIDAVETRALNTRDWITSLLFFGVFFVAFLFALFGRRVEWIPALVAGILAAFGLRWVISVARSRSSFASYGDAWLELEAPVEPGRPLQAMARFEKGVGGLSRLLVTLECWTCDWRGVKFEKLQSVRAVAAVTRVGGAAEASIRMDLPDGAPASRTPPLLRTGHKPSFEGVQLRKSERFTIWELSVSSGMRNAGIERSFRVPVGEEQVPEGAPGERSGMAEIPAPRSGAIPIIALVIANLVPIAGVLYFGWHVRDVVMLYWMENLVIGAYNLLRIATLEADRFQRFRDADAGVWSAAPRLGLSLFFIVHYGGFCAAHGIFLMVLFFDNPRSGLLPPAAEILGGLLRDPMIVVAVLALVASHGISFLRNHIAGGERNRLDPGVLMMRPYGRIIITHVAVLVGGMIMMRAREPLGLLLFFVGLKILLDVSSHWWEHAGRAR